ncbi:hypothetical protein KSU66_14265 [Sporosarcina sp. G11-34]|nr:hypothetical protein [Sporosarcina sp. G11-34]
MLIEDMERAEKNKERDKQIQKERIEKFYYTYPEFNSLGILFDSPRQKVIALLYDHKYKGTYKSKSTRFSTEVNYERRTFRRVTLCYF